jgi:hypothetical protein
VRNGGGRRSRGGETRRSSRVAAALARAGGVVVCGVAVAALLAACASRPRISSAPADGPLRWTPALGGTIALWVDPAASAPGWRPELVAVVTDAAAAWSAAGAPIRFRVVDSADRADVRVRWRHWQRGTTRGTTSRWVTARGEIAGADVVIVLAPGPRRQLSNPEVLRAIALHELGHALGLPHDLARSTVMRPSVDATALTERDRDALRAIYGAAPTPMGERRPARLSGGTDLRPHR